MMSRGVSGEVIQVMSRGVSGEVKQAELEVLVVMC